MVKFIFGRYSFWLKANKLSLNADKTKYTFFHKLSIRDNIPLKLPILKVNDLPIKRENAIKFLGIIIDENLTWKNHNKIPKNIGMLYKAKFLLNEKCLKHIFCIYTQLLKLRQYCMGQH